MDSHLEDPFSSPPTLAAATSLAALNVDYRLNMAALWKQFVHWCGDYGISFVDAAVVNHFIALVLMSKGCITPTKVFRASVAWVCAMFRFERTLDLMTIKLVDALDKFFDSGGRFLLSDSQVDKLRFPPKGDELPFACLKLLTGTGIRPGELRLLTPSSAQDNGDQALPQRKVGGFERRCCETGCPDVQGHGFVSRHSTGPTDNTVCQILAADTQKGNFRGSQQIAHGIPLFD